MKYLEERKQFAKELIEKKEAEYAQRESNALAKLKVQLNREHDQNMQIVNEKHAREVEELTNK